jgi:integrase
MLKASETVRLTEKSVLALPIPGETDPPQLYRWDARLAGFGVVVGRSGRRTFVLRRRVDGRLEKRTIGVLGEPRSDGQRWSVELARREAELLVGQIREGKELPGPRRERADGVTLRQALELHVEGMRADKKQPSSIAEFERETSKHLADWLDRPLKSITRSECRERHQALGVKDGGEGGTYLANRVMRYLRAAWNTAATEHEDLPLCPTVAVKWFKEHRRQEPIAWAKLPEVVEKIGALDNGVLRDYYLTLLYTGLRMMDAATIRWEHVNTTDEPITSRVWKAHRRKWAEIELPARSLLRTNPKGGEDRAFSIPLSGELVQIFERRRRENVTIVGADGGWVFPGHSLVAQECDLCAALGLPTHDPTRPTHLSNVRKRGIPSTHRFRDTYTTALAEAGISPYAIDVLTNHRPPKGSVTAGYIGLSDEHLTECQERVTAYIKARTERPGEPQTRAKARHLRVV